MAITSIFDNCTGLTIEQQVQRHLDDAPKPRRLEMIRELLLAASETDGLIAEVTSKAWNYLETHRLWESKYPSLEAFKDSIAYEITINDVLKRQEVLSQRQQADARGILTNWNVLPHDAIPPELLPPRFTKDQLVFLNRLSKVCILDRAITLLKAQVAQRLLLGPRTGGSRSSPKPHITTADILRVWEAVKLLISCPDGQLLLERSRAAEAARLHDGQTNEAAKGIQAPPPSQGIMEDSAPSFVASLPHADTSRASPATQRLGEYEGGNKENDCSATLPTRGDHRIEGTETDQEGDVNMGDNAADTQCHPEDASVPTSLDDRDQPMVLVGAVILTTAKTTTPTTIVTTTSQCSVGVKKLIDGIAVHSKFPALATLREMAPFESLCHNHFRRFAGNALGMVTNIKGTVLRKRLKWIYREKRQMVDVRQMHQSWFRGRSGNVWRITPPILVKGIKGECGNFQFDAVQVFNRFAGQDIWDHWVQDGTLILRNIFDHLREVESEIQSEFDMYGFHLGEQPGLPTMGWMRNMYHSGPQLLMYQDPVLWALTAAARPDKHWRLIAYPYNTKNAGASQKTGFLHLDLDLKRYQSEGLGKNTVQSAVSLTDENDKGCTLVVPGFHKHFQKWVRIRLESHQTIWSCLTPGVICKAKFSSSFPGW